jgi:hypothetical protein
MGKTALADDHILLARPYPKELTQPVKRKMPKDKMDIHIN